MDKKNTIFLTIIAIATLLVTAIGATFAFFTAQNSGPQSTDIMVKTETANASTIKMGGNINIRANDLNFAKQNVGGAQEYVGSQKGVTNASVSFSASSIAKESQKFCYTVSLVIDDKGVEGINNFTDGRTSNNIEYSKDNLEKKAELVFNISKAPKQNGYSDKFDETSKFKAYDNTNGTINDLEDRYQSNILTDTKICLNDVSYGEDYQYVENGKCTTGNISGWDITTKTGTIKIPKLKNGEEDASAQDNNEYVHMLLVPAGTTYTDYWQAEIILVNHDFDQSRNTGKTITGRLEFTPVDCLTGLPAE